MANEINIQAVLSLQRSTGSVVASGTQPITQSGANGNLNVQSIPTSLTALGLGNVSFASGGYLFVKNLDATNYVEISIDNAGTKIVFSRLKAFEFLLVPITPNGSYFAKANAASVFIQVGAAEA